MLVDKIPQSVIDAFNARKFDEPIVDCSDAYLKAMERIDAGYEPRGKVLNVQLAIHRESPEYKAYRSLRDQELTAERESLSAYRAKQMQHA